MPRSKNDKSSFPADYHQKSSGKRSDSSHSRPTALGLESAISLITVANQAKTHHLADLQPQLVVLRTDFVVRQVYFSVALPQIHGSRGKRSTHRWS